VVYVVGQTETGGYQHGEGLDVVLRLGEQVGSDQRGIGLIVCDDQDLTRTGQPIYPHLAKERLLGRCDVFVARANDQVTGRGQDAEGQGSDGLGATDGEQSVGSGDGCCSQGGIGRPWRGDPHGLHTSNPSRYHGHQDRGGQGITPTRRVGPHRCHRYPAMPGSASGDLDVDVDQGFPLSLREAPDP
jgi:hypothetical protein